MNRAPLALVFDIYLREWRAAQTAEQCRGHSYQAVLFLRKPAPEELTLVEAGLSSPELVFDLGTVMHEHYTNILKGWGIPIPGE